LIVEYIVSSTIGLLSDHLLMSDPMLEMYMP